MIYGYVYQTTLPDGRRYIGKHKSNERDFHYTGSGLILQNYIRKYRTKISDPTLTFDILKFCQTLEQLNSCEYLLIEMLKPELNLARGGAGGGSHEAALKAWQTKRKNGTTSPWNKGKRLNYAVWNTGQKTGPLSAEHRQKISASSSVAAYDRVARRRATYLGHHKRWHINRNLISANCEYCGGSR